MVKVFQFLLKSAGSLEVFPNSWISAILLFLAMAQEAVCVYSEKVADTHGLSRNFQGNGNGGKTSCDLSRHVSILHRPKGSQQRLGGKCGVRHASCSWRGHMPIARIVTPLKDTIAQLNQCNCKKQRYTAYRVPDT